MDEKFFRTVDTALQHWVKETPPSFGGNPGEPVPEADPDDVKTMWEMGRDVQAAHPGEHVAIGSEVFRAVCKPGANIVATGYRASFISLMDHFPPPQWAELTKEGRPSEAVFRAIATVPMEWVGVGIVREGPPFDFEKFLRLCNEP